MTLTPRTRALCAAACGTALVLLLLFVASLDGMLVATSPPPMLELLSVRLVETPPAPPQAPVTQDDGGSGGAPTLVRQNTLEATGLELDVMELNADLRIASGISGDFGSGFGGLGEGLGEYEFAVSDLASLDSIPVVVFAPSIDAQTYFRDTGLSEFTVRFHIAIDASGKATPVRLIDNPVPQLEAELLRYAAQVRFTPPTRAGIPVRTEYLWPVNFVDREVDLPQQRRGGVRTR